MKLSPATLLLTVTGVSGAAISPRHDGKALYFLDNNPAGASVVALQISEKDGTLSNPVRTFTGGVGLLGLTGTGAPGMSDTTFSQDIVVVSGNQLFTVSPGSNTLSVFAISPTNPSTLTPVGAPISTGGGDFPNSVAFSHALHLACVLNTGVKAGVACFHVDTRTGVTPSGDFVPLPGINQASNPPTGPPNTGSDIVFNPSSTALFVTVKGDGTNPGYIYAFPVVGDKISAKGVVVSRPPELLIDFSISFFGRDDTRAVVTDPAYGASFVEVSYPSLEVKVTKQVVVANQGATCWSVFSERFNAVFIFDGGNPNVTTLDPATGDVKYTIVGPTGKGGSFDSIASGKYLYVLQGAAGISVFSLEGSVGAHKVPKLVQSLELSGLGSRQGWMGLAVYPN